MEGGKALPLLQPIAFPGRLWSHIAVDLITDLPVFPNYRPSSQSLSGATPRDSRKLSTTLYQQNLTDLAELLCWHE